METGESAAKRFTCYYGDSDFTPVTNTVPVTMETGESGAKCFICYYGDGDFTTAPNTLPVTMETVSLIWVDNIQTHTMHITYVYITYVSVVDQ